MLTAIRICLHQDINEATPYDQYIYTEMKIDEVKIFMNIKRTLGQDIL